MRLANHTNQAISKERLGSKLRPHRRIHQRSFKIDATFTQWRAVLVRLLKEVQTNARRFSAWDQVFAGIIVIIALALATYQFMVWLKRRLYPWETQQ